MISQLATILAAVAGVGADDAPGAVRYPAEWRRIPSDSPLAPVAAVVQAPAPTVVPLQGASPIIVNTPANVTATPGTPMPSAMQGAPATPLLSGAPCSACAAAAEAKPECPKSPWFANGWLAGSYTWNPQNPKSRFNGPVTFNDRSNDALLNQAYLRFGKTVDAKGGKIDFGGQIDVMYGSDALYTQAFGLDNNWNPGNRYNGAALPQLYGEAFVPMLKGLDIKIGHFYTPLGYETLTSPDRFFPTVAYAYQYGEPFTHTGVLANLGLTDKLSLLGGYVAGWDSFRDNNGQASWIGGVEWKNDDRGTDVTFRVINGPEQDGFGRAWQGFGKVDALGNPAHGTLNRFLYNLIVQQKLGEKTRYVLQHDHGWQRGAPTDEDVAGANGRSNAQWYGITQYLFHDVSDTVSLGIRGEWFRDRDGFRVAPVRAGLYGFSNPERADYYEIAVGANWKAAKNLTIRPELRWDWARLFDKSEGAGDLPFGSANDKRSQFIAAFDLIYKF